MNNKFRNNFIMAGSLIALALGLITGIVFKQAGVAQTWVDGFDLIGKLWVNALIILVIPLVLSYLVYTILSMIHARTLGKIGAYALLVHTLILLAGVVYSLVFSFTSLELLHDLLPTLSVPVAVDQKAVVAENPALLQRGLNILNAMLSMIGKLVLLLMLAAVAWATVVARYYRVFARRLLAFSQWLSEKAMAWLGNYLLSLPFAVFALALPMAATTGFSAIGVAGYYVLLCVCLIIGFLLLFYILVYLKGSVSVGHFARAMLPPQVVAVTTRSSLASLPALMETAEHQMQVPKPVTAVIIPFFVSLFRCNRVVTSPFNVLFLLYVYRLPLDVTTLAIFVLAQIVLSFGTPGIPSGGRYINLPLYLAAGVPLEGYILIKAVDAIPDIFKTVLNVTEVMTVTTIVVSHVKESPALMLKQ